MQNVTTLNNFFGAKQSKSVSKKKGFTLIEFAIVAVLIGFAVYYVAPRITAALGTSKVDNQVTQVQTILQGARKYGTKTGDKTGITMLELSNRNLVDPAWGDGTAINPWAGDVAVAVGADVRTITITINNIENNEQGQLLVDELSEYTTAAPAYAAGTFTGIFRVG